MMLRPGRVQGMIRLCKQHDTHIPCHEHSTRQTDSEGLSEINLDDPICRGFYNNYPGVGQMIRMCERLGLMREVE
jgi:hypothetical protein